MVVEVEEEIIKAHQIIYIIEVGLVDLLEEIVMGLLTIYQPLQEILEDLLLLKVMMVINMAAVAALVVEEQVVWDFTLTQATVTEGKEKDQLFQVLSDITLAEVEVLDTVEIIL